MHTAFLEIMEGVFSAFKKNMQVNLQKIKNNMIKNENWKYKLQKQNYNDNSDSKSSEKLSSIIY
jgi:hypothetical protein